MVIFSQGSGQARGSGEGRGSERPEVHISKAAKNMEKVINSP
jgi:hypothetical protein